MTGGPQRNGLVVIGLVGEGVRFLTGACRDVRGKAKQAGESLAQALRLHRPVDPRALVLFSDGLSINGAEFLRGIHEHFGQHLPVAGGASADNFYFQRCFQFFDEDVFHDGAVAMMITGEVRVGVAARHGWLPVGRPRRVTQASGEVLQTLDRKPAVSIYEDFLGLSREELSENPIARVAMTYPLGVPRASRGESYLLRGALRVGDQGSLVCAGDIRPGTDVQLMMGGYEAALEAAQQAAHDAIKAVGYHRVNGALVFSSVARQKMLGSEFQGEIDVIRGALGGQAVRMAGFYGYGEYGGSEFQNESVSVLVMGS